MYTTLQQYGTSHEHSVTDLILTAISHIDNNEIQKVIEDLNEEVSIINIHIHTQYITVYLKATIIDG